MTEMTAEMTSRPAGSAKWISSLRLRLALAIAISVALAGIGAGALALQRAQQALIEDVRGIAGRTSAQAADEVGRLAAPLSEEAVSRTLRALDAAVSEIEQLSYVEDTNQGPTVLATTGMLPGEAGLGLGVLAVRENRRVTTETRGTVSGATPRHRAAGAPAAAVARGQPGASARVQP